MNIYVRGIFVIIGISISSEIIYQTYEAIRKYLKEREKRIEINEVRFPSKRSMECLGFHAKSGNDKLKCSNPYCYEENQNRLIRLIDSATTSINLCMYLFTMSDIISALIRAKNRGVLVRVITDDAMSYSTGSKIANLIEQDIPVHRNRNENVIMHHKFCLIDVEWDEKFVRDYKKSLISGERKKLENVLLASGSTENANENEKKCVSSDQNESVSLGKSVCKKSSKSSSSNGILITGSLNWTLQGFTTNWENYIITTNSTLVHQFQQEFQKLWCDFQYDQI